MIYFIEAVGLNQIKIGRTNDVAKRLAALQTANATKLELVAAFVGGEELEIECHSIYAAFRLHGEWFRAEEVKSSLHLVKGEPVPNKVALNRSASSLATKKEQSTRRSSMR